MTLSESERAILQKCLEPLRAEEQIGRAYGSRIARARNEDYKREITRLGNLASPLQKIEVAMVSAEHAAWFEANGIPHKII